MGSKVTLKRWHILEDDALVLTRAWPPRFDVVAETMLPMVARRKRLAHQIRQDVWRALQSQKGFSPVIEIRSDAREDALRIRAGGRVDQASFSAPVLESRIAAVLDDPARRARWIAFANRPYQRRAA